MDKGDWRCDMYFGTTRCCLPLGHLGQHTGSNVEAVKATPSKESLERARKFLDEQLELRSPMHSWLESLAIDFDAIALESERNVCQILRGENSSAAALEPLRMSDAMDSYRDAIARERDEVTEKLAEALNFMYLYFVMPGHPERAKDCPNKDCPFCKADAVLAAYRERMRRS